MRFLKKLLGKKQKPLNFTSSLSLQLNPTLLLNSLLQTFGVIIDISQTLIGLTILSWANSAADSTADTLLTRYGYGEMAMTAAFAGPCLNLLLGTGLFSTFNLCFFKIVMIYPEYYF